MMEKNKSKTQGTVRTVALMMAATVAAKVFGMLRSVFMASHYGAGTVTDAFTAAAHIPLTFFDLLFGAAILGCFIPVYNSFARREDGQPSEQADDFACMFLNLILLSTGLLALIGILFSPLIVSLFAAGLDAQTQALAATLLRIMFPMIIFTGSTYTLTGVMQSRGSFMLPACVSLFSNAIVILYFIFFDRLFGESGIYALAAAYLVAWFTQLATLGIPLLRSGFRFKAILDLKDPALRKAIRSAPPIMLGSWLTPAGTLIAIHFASLLSEGTASQYDYAYNVFAILAGTLTYSICNYYFPTLSRLAVEKDEEGFCRTVKTGLGASAAILFPFIAAVLLLSGEGISILYLRGEFTPEAASGAAVILRTLALGMPGFAVVEICSRVFYARSEPKIPMLAALLGIMSNCVSTALLTENGILGSAGVGLGNAIGLSAAAILLIVMLFLRARGVFDREFLLRILKTLGCALISAAVMAVIFHFLSSVGGGSYQRGMVMNIVVCAAVFAPGAAVYLVLLKLCRLMPEKTKN